MNTRDKPGFNARRAELTRAFVEATARDALVLDIGEKNRMSEYLGKALGINIVNTCSDLDYSIEPCSPGNREYGTVFCFEVIEHLLNPRLFFDNLHRLTTSDVRVYLSYPSRPRFLWNNEEHFHEYDLRRFRLLLQKTGFRIVENKRLFIPNWGSLLKGIRPWSRLVLPLTTIYLIVKEQP